MAILALIAISCLLATITCALRPGVTYERYDNALTTQVTQEDLTANCKKATSLLQRDEALLDAAADMTCGVYRQISSALVKNAAAPSDPTQTITQEEQTALNAKAQAQFETTKRTYMAFHNNQPLLECFAEQDATKAEAEVRAAVLALDAQLNASKMKMKARGVRATLGFTAPYVGEIVKAFSEGFYGNGTGCDGSADRVATTITTLTGRDLVAKGVALYNEAMTLHADIQGLPRIANLQRDALAAVKAKQETLNNPSDSETAHYKEEGKDDKYKE